MNCDAGVHKIHDIQSASKEDYKDIVAEDLPIFLTQPNN
jgi:hypothetical protein